MLVVDPNTVLRIRRALDRAAPPPATVDERGWRDRRDGLLDVFEAGRTAEVDEATLRRLIDLLSEATAASDARLSETEWRRQIDELVPELLALGRD